MFNDWWLWLTWATGASGADLHHPDVVHLVPHLRQRALHLPQMEVEGELLIVIHLDLLIISQRSCCLFIALRRGERMRRRWQVMMSCLRFWGMESLLSGDYSCWDKKILKSSHAQEADVILTDGLHLQCGSPVHQLAKLHLQLAHQPLPLWHHRIQLVLNPADHLRPDPVQWGGNFVQEALHFATLSVCIVLTMNHDFSFDKIIIVQFLLICQTWINIQHLQEI